MPLSKIQHFYPESTWRNAEGESVCDCNPACYSIFQFHLNFHCFVILAPLTTMANLISSQQSFAALDVSDKKIYCMSSFFKLASYARRGDL